VATGKQKQVSCIFDSKGYYWAAGRPLPTKYSHGDDTCIQKVLELFDCEAKDALTYRNVEKKCVTSEIKLKSMSDETLYQPCIFKMDTSVFF
jgi:hypothetical protein